MNMGDSMDASLLSRDELESMMNRYGKEKRAFLFMAGYDKAMNHLWDLDKIPTGVAYSTPWFADSSGIHASFEKAALKSYPVSRESYRAAFEVVKKNINHGNSYLLNLTQATPVTFKGTLADIYKSAVARYKLHLPDKFVLFSPEIFVRIEGNKISGFPMKGTIDASIPDAVKEILNDPKEIAEHNTIVDLIRNDLSMVALNVTVSRYRYIDVVKVRGRDLIQVSSEITGSLLDDWRDRVGSIICSMLPAGSVTGAPKAETCRIIEEAEGYHRGWYTGVFGVFDGTKLDSGVMIRFIEKDKAGYLYKSGGGITYLSDADKEYYELISKIYVPIG